MNLVFIRHGQSLWNLENKFTGWVDIDLSERGEVEAKTAGVTLIDNNFYPEICFTSYLKRSINTAAHITENFKNMNITYENVKKWELNERHYGALTGLNKIEMSKKIGEDRVYEFRRSWDIKPEALDRKSPYHPINIETYKNLSENAVGPLKDLYAEYAKALGTAAGASPDLIKALIDVVPELLT